MIADFFSQRISIIMGHFLIGMGLIIETGTLIDNTSLMSIKGTPAGGGASTVEDILNFNEALLSYRLLTPEATELLLAGKVEIREGIRYAYGLMDKMIGGQRVVGHGGNAPGICNFMDMYLDPGYTIIILSNTDGGCLFVREFIRENPLNTAHEKKKWARLGLNQRPSDYESES